MRSGIAVIVSFLVLTAVISVAHADRYDCEAVANSARLGVYGTNAVSIAVDSGRKECRFSVNGATTGSPRLDLVLKGLNAIAAKSMRRLINEGDLEPLANLLLAPTRFEGVPGDLMTLLRKISNELADCFVAYEEPVIGFAKRTDQLSCSVVPPRRDTVKIGRLSVVNDAPQLQLMVVFQEQDLFLFVPIKYREGMPPIIPP